jgi:hypothetical protein
MQGRQYVSTGEAARVLRISRSTVSRKFDSGEISGRLNPITGERLVSLESLLEFMRRHHMPTDELEIGLKRILLATTFPDLRSQVKALVTSDERLHLATAELGSDTLILAAREDPDLLVIGDDLKDLGCPDIISSLRKRQGETRLKILCCPRHASLETADEWGADACLSGRPLDEAALHDMVYAMLQLADTRPQNDVQVKHKRRWRRLAVELPSRIGVYPTSAPRKYAWGTAVVRNISRGGAFLSNIDLAEGAIPSSPFRMLLEVDHHPLKQWRAYCQVVRLQSNGSLAAGLRFARISKVNRRQVASLVG